MSIRRRFQCAYGSDRTKASSTAKGRRPAPLVRLGLMRSDQREIFQNALGQ